MGGLGAFLEPCRAGLAAEAEKCTPEVAKNAQFGWNLEAKLKPKSITKIYQNVYVFCSFLKLSWKRKRHQNHSKMEPKIDLKTLSRELGSESGESVILNNTTAF